MKTVDSIQAFRRFGNYSNKEIIHLIITAIVFGFILSFRKWGYEGEYIFSVGLMNLIFYSIVSLLALAIMFTTEKFFAIKFGYRGTYRMWGTGLGISTFLCFLTNGIPLSLTSGGLDLKRDERFQLGYYYKGPVFRKISQISFIGLFSLVLYVCIISILPIAEGTKSNIIFTTMLIGAFSLLPLDAIMGIWNENIPNSNGVNLFFGNKAFFAFAIAFYFSAWALIYFTGFWTIFISLIVGLLAMLYWLFFGTKNKFWVSVKK
jgi:hypothetical protein